MLLLILLFSSSLYAEADYYYPGQLIGDLVVTAPDTIVVRPIEPPTRILEVRLLGLSSHQELVKAVDVGGKCAKKPIDCSGSGGYWPFQETYSALFATKNIIRDFCQDPEGIWIEWFSGERGDVGILRCKTSSGIFDVNTMILLSEENQLKKEDLRLLDTRSKLLWSTLMPFFQDQISDGISDERRKK